MCNDQKNQANLKDYVLWVGLCPWDLGVTSETGSLYSEGRERPKTEAGHSRWAGGRCKKQGHLLRRLALGATRQVDPSPAIRMLDISIEALWISITYTFKGISATFYFLKALSSKLSSLFGKWGQDSQDRGEGEEPLVARVQLSGQLAISSSR